MPACCRRSVERSELETAPGIARRPAATSAASASIKQSTVEPVPTPRTWPAGTWATAARPTSCLSWSWFMPPFCRASGGVEAAMEAVGHPVGQPGAGHGAIGQAHRVEHAQEALAAPQVIAGADEPALPFPRAARPGHEHMLLDDRVLAEAEALARAAVDVQPHQSVETPARAGIDGGRVPDEAVTLRHHARVHHRELHRLAAGGHAQAARLQVDLQHPR
mmetsp:Transcript_57647/g.135650  ORF Transcript_57647/g.135650 Transcript_57647/m.135650 type:complete len:220 (+) Transcript_57647:2312-2971(+)